MHTFAALAGRCTEFTLRTLIDAERKIEDDLQENPTTPLIKFLQMVTLQKSVLAVGIFSMFEATLQDELDCKDGFKAIDEILCRTSDGSLRDRFNNFRLAINVLKHGYGRSYEELISKNEELPFEIKKADEPFFQEGDVSEISTLIKVDDHFLRNCVQVIHEVSDAIGLC